MPLRPTPGATLSRSGAAVPAPRSGGRRTTGLRRYACTWPDELASTVKPPSGPSPSTCSVTRSWSLVSVLSNSPAVAPRASASAAVPTAWCRRAASRAADVVSAATRRAAPPASTQRAICPGVVMAARPLMVRSGSFDVFFATPKSTHAAEPAQFVAGSPRRRVLAVLRARWRAVLWRLRDSGAGGADRRAGRLRGASAGGARRWSRGGGPGVGRRYGGMAGSDLRQGLRGLGAGRDHRAPASVHRPRAADPQPRAGAAADRARVPVPAHAAQLAAIRLSRQSARQGRDRGAV